MLSLRASISLLTLFYNVYGINISVRVSYPVAPFERTG
jgi:hypothetical protein